MSCFLPGNRYVKDQVALGPAGFRAAKLASASRRQCTEADNGPGASNASTLVPCLADSTALPRRLSQLGLCYMPVEVQAAMPLPGVPTRMPQILDRPHFDVELLGSSAGP